MKAAPPVHIELQGKLQIVLTSEALVMAQRIAIASVLLDLLQPVHNNLVAILALARRGDLPNSWQHPWQPLPLWHMVGQN